MKRHEKIALLTKLVQGQVNEAVRQRLRESQENEAIIGIFSPDKNPPSPDDEIVIQERDKEIRIPYKELDQYAWRKGISVIFLLPDNQR
ncbi:hypothetical protein [Spirosoma sp.]|uniref:hypothetical protein n=1 Tax=Spirosoma sp. TaxID=1899569 RepID=UPI00262F0BCE|nr:hypothetical protein [Spirosoma sp.]MCX6214653.1 hypothetical protein [Spirosoma sp.]